MLSGPPRWLPRRPARLARGHFAGHLAGMRRPPLRMCNPESRLLQSGSRVSGHRLDTATVAQRPRPWRVREAASAQASVTRLNPSRGVRPSRPVSGMQPGFSSHVWGASGCLRLGLCSLVPAARVCLTLRMRGTGRGERWECDPQMDAPLRAPPSPEGHRATGIFQNELPWQVPRARLSGFLTRGLSLASPHPPPLAGSAWVWRGPCCLTGSGGFHRGRCQLLLEAAIWDAGFVRI